MYSRFPCITQGAVVIEVMVEVVMGEAVEMV